MGFEPMTLLFTLFNGKEVSFELDIIDKHS